jgi:hypothetical protein
MNVASGWVFYLKIYVLFINVLLSISYQHNVSYDWHHKQNEKKQKIL